jgi:mannose-6-phosphate isomerase
MDCLTELLATVRQVPTHQKLGPESAHLATAKVLAKHWGEERWLVPESSPFGFKLITIHPGKRTSLQYHRRKEEANLILCGEGLLYIAEDVGAPLKEQGLAPGHIAHIRPGRVHRIEALTELLLVEVSTPELDDVVRIEDDMGRGDGRIESEHL